MAGAEEDGVVRVTAATPVPTCIIKSLSVTPGDTVPELQCTMDAVVELGGGRRVAVEVDGPGRWLTKHPHTQTRTGPTELRMR